MKKNLKFLLALTLAVTILIPLQAFAVEEQPNVSVLVGEKKTLTAVIDLLTKEDPEKLKVDWESEQPKIASVDSRGNVTGIAKGKAKINAVVTGNANFKASVIVDVISTVKDLKVEKTKMWLRVGEALPINYEVLPSNAYLKDVQFKSSDSKIAKVDSKGLVTGVGDGSVEVTATTKDGDIEKIITIHSISTVKSVEFLESQDEIILRQDEKRALKYRVLPGDAFLKDVKFKSGSTKVATVDKDGVVKAVGSGSVEIIVETVDGQFTDTIKIKVNGEPIVATESIDIEGAEQRNIFVGQEEALTTVVSPKGSIYSGRLEYKSSNPEVLFVSASGKIKGLSGGKATITASVSDVISDSVTFNVIPTVTGIKGPSEMTVYVGEEKEVPVTLLPATAYDRTIFIDYDGREFLKVNASKDTVTGLKEGTVNALFTSEDGGFTHEMKIHVVGMVKSVDIPFEKLEMGLEPVVIEPKFNPTNAFNKKLKYEVIGDRNVISINASKNELKPNQEGEVRVKVTSEDGGHTDEFTVNVKFDVKNIKIYDDEDNLVGNSDPASGKPIVKPSEPSDENETENPSDTDDSGNNSTPSYVKKIIIQKLIDRTDNPLVKIVLEQLLVKYS